MSSILNEMQRNNINIDEKLLVELQRFNQTNHVVLPSIESPKFTINHPFDSNLFRDAIKDVDKILDESDEVIAYSVRW